MTDYKLIPFRVLTTTEREDVTEKLDEKIRMDQRLFSYRRYSSVQSPLRVKGSGCNIFNN